MEKFIAWLEKHLMPIANKIAKQRHLMAIRDTFMTILPPLFFGAIVAVINAGSGFESTNAFLVAWKNFATNNSLILGWLNLITMSVMSLYVCIGITYYLSKRYELNVFMPLITAVAGFVMLASYPQELGYGNALVQITYWDGKGILVAIFVAIFTVEMFKLMRDKKVGYIKMPDSVPAALSDTFASLVPTIIILTIDSIIFTICSKAAGTSLAGVVINILSPAFEVADSLPVAMLVAFLLNVGWFFGIHDAVWSGLLAPIEYGTLSINAAAKAAGAVLPHVFTVSFWCYFGIIGGLGNCLALGILCLTSKKEDIKMVGKLGIIPAFFGISEPITFGLPIMLNPILFIPCFLTSIVNVTVSYLLMSADVIGRTFAMLSYNMPSIFGSYLATGDIKAAVLIVVLILVDIVIYYPFFKAHERNCDKLMSE